MLDVVKKKILKTGPLKKACIYFIHSLNTFIGSLLGVLGPGDRQ